MPQYTPDIEGIYVFTPVLPQGYTLDGETLLPQITIMVQAAEEMETHGDETLMASETSDETMETETIGETQVIAASRSLVPAAVYLNGESGDDSADGKTEATAVKSITKAQELLTDGGTIIITGTITENSEKSVRLTGGIIVDGSGENVTSPAVVVKSGTLQIMDETTIRGNHNTASNGGAVLVESGAAAKVYISSITGNSALCGGGIYAQSGSDLQFMYTSSESGRCINVTGNSAVLNGGGVYIESGATAKVSPVVNIRGNTVNGKANNIYLPESVTLGLQNNVMLTGAYVGITPEKLPVLDGTITVVEHGISIIDFDNSPLDQFYCDIDGYKAGFGSDDRKSIVFKLPQHVAYLGGASASDSNNGLSAATAVRTVEKAMSLLEDGDTVVVCGEAYTASTTQQTKINKSLTFTGTYEGVTYDDAVLKLCNPKVSKNVLFKDLVLSNLLTSSDYYRYWFTNNVTLDNVSFKEKSTELIGSGSPAPSLVIKNSEKVQIRSIPQFDTVTIDNSTVLAYGVANSIGNLSLENSSTLFTSQDIRALTSDASDNCLMVYGKVANARVPLLVTGPVNVQEGYPIRLDAYKDGLQDGLEFIKCADESCSTDKFYMNSEDLVIKKINDTITAKSRVALTVDQMEILLPTWVYGDKAEPEPSGSITEDDVDGQFTYTYSIDEGSTWINASQLLRSGGGAVNAGTYLIKMNYISDNYIGSKTKSFTISEKEVSVDAGNLAVDSKPYDGNKSVGLSGSPKLKDVISGDHIWLEGYTGSFASEEPGDNITVTIEGFELAGDDAANYKLPENATVIRQGNITKADGKLNPAYMVAYQELQNTHIVVNVTPTRSAVTLPSGWQFIGDTSQVLKADNNYGGLQSFEVKYISSNPHYENVVIDHLFPVSHVAMEVNGGLDMRYISKIGDVLRLSPVTLKVTGAPLPETGVYAAQNMEWHSSCQDIAKVTGDILDSHTLYADVTAEAKGVTMIALSYKNSDILLGYVLVKVTDNGSSSGNTIEEIKSITETLMGLIDPDNVTDTDKKAVNAVADEITKLPKPQKDALKQGDIEDLEWLKQVVNESSLNIEIIKTPKENPPKPQSIKVVGAAIASGVDSGSVKIYVTPVKPDGSDAMMEIHLEMLVDGLKTQLKAPLFFSMELPENMDLSNLSIVHITKNGSKEVTFLHEGQTIYFKLNSFSSLKFIDKTYEPETPGESEETDQTEESSQTVESRQTEESNQTEESKPDETKKPAESNKPDKDTDQPKTGDYVPIIPLAVMMIVSGTVIVLRVRRKKKA